MLHKLLILISVLLLISCTGNTQPSNSENVFSTEYVPARKDKALAGAEKYCLTKKKDLKIISTDCAWRCVSVFRCVAANQSN